MTSSRTTCVSIDMTQTNRLPYHCCKDNQNLSRLDQASPNPIYPQDRQEDTNREEPISQVIFPTHACVYKSDYDNELAPSFDVVGCSTNHCCKNRSANAEMGDHNEHKFEQVQVSTSRSFPGIIDVPTNLDGGLNFVDFELFDSQCEQCEEFHDIWLDPSISIDSSKLHLDDDQSCKSFDTFDTPRSSEMSLYYGDFCSPPPKSVTSSWRDYLEASNSEFVVGVGQWMCGTMAESNDLEDEPKILRNTNNNTTSRTNKAIDEILDSLELIFYGVE
ncbi:hypothetical protein BCON_0250g00030 [Botryotinia convoluta]|uniref:Uncharacterized protein n=1 Tax=Botryotinia convoluta TaxID=54673 RepID=A0A4Z1HN00_9HELO|nr:hypothetical protein BCON_0250g00030 [Botryotinia convoluta]